MKEVRLLSLDRITIAWAWYDLWIGAYIDRKNKIVYICPVPTLLVSINLGKLISNVILESRPGGTIGSVTAL